MEIENVKDKKVQLECDLKKLLDTFTKETGCDVAYLNFEKVKTIGQPTTYLPNTEIALL